MKKCTILDSNTFEDHRGTIFSYYDFDEKFGVCLAKKGVIRHWLEMEFKTNEAQI